MQRRRAKEPTNKRVGFKESEKSNETSGSEEGVDVDDGRTLEMRKKQRPASDRSRTPRQNQAVSSLPSVVVGEKSVATPVQVEAARATSVGEEKVKTW